MRGTEATLLWRMVVIGVLTQIAQVFLFREAFASMRGLGLLYGVALASGLVWTAVGTVAGGAAARRSAVTPRRSLWFSLAPFVFFGPALALGLVLLRLGAVLLAGAPGAPLDLSVASLLVVAAAAPASLCGGFAGGFLLGSADKHHAALLYGLETVGILISGVLCTFVLAPRIAPVSLALLSGGLALLGMLVPAAGKNRPPVGMVVLLASLAVFMIMSALSPVDDMLSSVSWSRTLPRYQVHTLRETPYGRITSLADSSTGHRVVFHNNDLVYSGEPDRRDPAAAELAAVCCAQRDSLGVVGVMGGGLGELPARILEHGADRVDIIELDPGLFEAIDPRPEGVPAPMRRIGLDGRHFLRIVDGPQYDILLLTLPDLHSSATNRFGTREFFAEVSRVLTPGGVLCVLVPTYGAGPEYQADALVRRTASVAAAVGSVFPVVDAAPVHGHLLLATNLSGGITFNPSLLGRRLLERPAAWPPDLYPFLSAAPDSIRIELLTSFVADIGGGVLRADGPSLGREGRQPLVELLRTRIRDVEVRLNTDQRPAAVLYSFELWNDLMHPGDDRSSLALSLLQMLAQRKGSVLEVVLVLFLLLLVCALVAGFRTLPGGAPPRAPATRIVVYLITCMTGAFGITVVVFLLHVYQSAQGYVYSQIGLLTAMSMAGMALGALAATRWVAHADGSRRTPIAVVGFGLGGMVLISLLARVVTAWIAEAATGEGAFGVAAAVLAASGFAAGVMFPALLRLLLTAEGDMLYAMDLVGSALGAIILSTVVMTAVGPIAAMDALAVLLLSMVVLFVVLVLIRRGHMPPV